LKTVQKEVRLGADQDGDSGQKGEENEGQGKIGKTAKGGTTLLTV